MVELLVLGFLSYVVASDIDDYKYSPIISMCDNRARCVDINTADISRTVEQHNINKTKSDF